MWSQNAIIFIKARVHFRIKEFYFICQFRENYVQVEFFMCFVILIFGQIFRVMVNYGNLFNLSDSFINCRRNDFWLGDFICIFYQGVWFWFRTEISILGLSIRHFMQFFEIPQHSLTFNDPVTFYQTKLLNVCSLLVAITIPKISCIILIFELL